MAPNVSVPAKSPSSSVMVTHSTSSISVSSLALMTLVSSDSVASATNATVPSLTNSISSVLASVIAKRKTMQAYENSFYINLYSYTISKIKKLILIFDNIIIIIK